MKLSLWFSLLVVALLCGCEGSKDEPVTQNTYYISSSDPNADDNGPGTVEEPWRTLSRASSQTFLPGQSVMLKRGDTWVGETLYLRGSGTSANWITLSAYGTGERPVISPYASPEAISASYPDDAAKNGLLYAIKLESTAGWRIIGLEIANSKSGIVYVNGDEGVRDGLWVEDCYIHDITNWPLTPYPAAENRVPELVIMPYSVGIFTFLNSGERLQNVTIRNCTFERTDAPLEIRHADHVEVDSITATDSYREGVIFTGINYDHAGQPKGSFTNSQILRTGSHGMTWGTAGLALNAVHQFTVDNVEIAYTVSPDSPDGVGIDYEGLNKDVTVQNSYIHDNDDEAVMYYRNPQWSNGIENVNTSLINNRFVNNGIKQDGKLHAAFLVHANNLDNGGTLSGNTIVLKDLQQPLNMIAEMTPQFNEYWPGRINQESYHIQDNRIQLSDGRTVNDASAGYSNIQGGNGWHYEQVKEGIRSAMSWDRGSGQWKGATGKIVISDHEMQTAGGIDALREWISPIEGEITITGKVQLSAGSTASAQVSILKNNDMLWDEAVKGSKKAQHELSLSVKAGDVISFVIRAADEAAVDWNPRLVTP
ncbi:right-handed parallel beta-helix repeat-containing protein [Paenibacillus mendelii]|uniref:Right-handed parallel beta-helix repeat-containing protein n=1 Tax=Paenibacillus mendelii TaxID=206163 RepID=A0ABV6JL85_9BACL|nr:right-handed parallel beta-helix repeat-containing protein [Paenibacillus mendelii]MCQ6562320.1 right-handed parallel beta-helix repeat-containing protein [Paenibacillus mendelii]